MFGQKQRDLVLYSGVPNDEIKGVLEACFATQPVAGLRDSEGTYFPVDLLSKSPEFGHNKVFELVVGTGSQLYGAKHGAARDSSAGLDLDDVRELIGLHNHSVEDVFEAFAEGADEEGRISRTVFRQCFALTRVFFNNLFVNFIGA